MAPICGWSPKIFHHHLHLHPNPEMDTETDADHKRFFYSLDVWCNIIVHVPINPSGWRFCFHLTRSNLTGLNSTNQNKISMEDQTQLDEILNELLNNDNYFQSPPPKSTSTPAPPSGEMVPSHGSLTTHSGTFGETDEGSAGAASLWLSINKFRYKIPWKCEDACAMTHCPNSW